MTACVGTRADLLERTFRANPAYEFIPFRRFAGAERELIEDLERDGDICGMLRPLIDSTLGVKAATRSLAALFRARQSPGALPARLRSSASEQTVNEIVRLVLDGILEVERDGEFVAGAGADHLLSEAEQRADTSDPLEALSWAATQYGDTLDIDSSLSLSARIYFFNRLPVTPRWAHRLPTRDATLEFLGLATGSETRRFVDRRWALAPSDDPQGWLTWNPRDFATRRSPSAPVHKLYVSPMPGELREAVAVVARTLAEFERTAFKVGPDVHGLLRPDKLVIYVSTGDDAEAIGGILARSLDGMTPHGVPFTAAMDPSGLVSRGLDPPRTLKILSWRNSESWRLWVTNRLAVYLLTARATRTEASTMTGAQFAIARLRLDGIDTRQWTPDAATWAQQPT